ncbi:MAG: DUF4234 domain-containing protein [Defluviitaleaceae bacterium]|nr:DUF4234 domain-containing protein [Defluviitaleaceae bacterium]
MYMEKRSIASCIILSILTCGIYSFYWDYKMWDSLYRANGMMSKAGTDLILSLVTCGIYYIYMHYKAGKLEAEAYRRHGLGQKDESVVYLVLTIFGLGIISQALLQSSINSPLADAVNSNLHNQHQNPHGQF